MTTAVYAGSFDPVTLGHLDLIYRAAGSFSRLIVAIGVNSSKKPLFTPDERVALIRASIEEHWRAAHATWEVTRAVDPGDIAVVSFSGLLVEFCKSQDATVIVRGLRAVTDFEAELGIAHANASMMPKIDTFFLPTKPQYSFVSSSTVREIASHKSEAGWQSLPQYVSPPVLEALKIKYQQKA